MKLYLVRHGQSTGNVGDLLMGQSDHPLTELGERQARAAAARLAPFGPMPVHCSDLPRALATAQRITEAWPAAGPADLPLAVVAPEHRLQPDARLREIDLGEYEGRPWQQFDADTALTAAMSEDPFHTVLPNGESLAQLEVRVLAAVRDVLARDGAASGGAGTGGVGAERVEAACIVSHDGPIRAILNHYLGVPPQKWWTLSTTHGGFSLLEFGHDLVAVRYVNDTSHLADLRATEYMPSLPGTAG
jgi:broad specificity phosphatase PhoE